MNQLLIFLFFSAFLNGTVSAIEDEKRPNIIIILADDMGYSDIGCMGEKLKLQTLMLWRITVCFLLIVGVNA